jgi:hypothetical protein
LLLLLLLACQLLQQQELQLARRLLKQLTRQRGCSWPSQACHCCRQLLLHRRCQHLWLLRRHPLLQRLLLLPAALRRAL